MSEKQTNLFGESVSTWKERFDADRKKAIEDKGLVDFWKLPKGTTEFEVRPEPVRTVQSKFGERLGFAITVDGEDKELVVNRKCPLAREIIEGLIGGKTSFKVLRSGSGLDTRYELLE